jgi:hypothetical protein
MFSFLLKKKVAHIAEDAQTIVRRTGGATGTILALGAYDVDPRLLMFVVQVAKDADREKLKERPALAEALKELPKKHGWPADACGDVVFHIESQETVDREHEGNWAFRFG